MQVQFPYSEKQKKHTVIHATEGWYILESQPVNWGDNCHIAVRKNAVMVVEEPTYRIGQRFLVAGQEAILAQVCGPKVALIDLQAGNRFKDPIDVKNAMKISLTELNSMSYGSISLKG